MCVRVCVCFGVRITADCRLRLLPFLFISRFFLLVLSFDFHISVLSFIQIIAIQHKYNRKTHREPRGQNCFHNFKIAFLFQYVQDFSEITTCPRISVITAPSALQRSRSEQ